MKKFITIILALALIFAMTSLAFAYSNQGYLGNVSYEVKQQNNKKTIVFTFEDAGVAEGVIEGDTFIGANDIEQIIIEEGVTEIGSQVFKNMKGLKDVYIPASVERIASDAFDGCPTLSIHYAGDQPEIITSGSFISGGCVAIIAAVVVAAAVVVTICVKKKKKA